MTVVSELTSQFGVAAACQALAVPSSSFYRSGQVHSPKGDPPSPRELLLVEQQVSLSLLIRDRNRQTSDFHVAPCTVAGSLRIN